MGRSIECIAAMLRWKLESRRLHVYTTDTQGEIDVIGVAHAPKQAYICEVATCLTTGSQYFKNTHPDTAERPIKKFVKGIDYTA